MEKSRSRRAVITGVGAVTPLGNSVPKFWEGIRSGTSGADAITKFDTTEYRTRIACEVKDFRPEELLSKREIRRLDPFSQYSAVATLEAMKDAGLNVGDVEPSRLSVIFGVGIGGLQSLTDGLFKIFKTGPKHVEPLMIPKLISNTSPAYSAILCDAHGLVCSVTTACASANDAMNYGLHLIRSGAAEVVITGGVEACITQMGICGFNVLHALSVKYNDRPQIASRPFDSERDGFVIGEGAGIMVLEDYERAVARGARIHAELVGTGNRCDAYHMTAPHTDGRGAKDAMREALADAGLTAGDIDYINAHGTSTKLNDAIETKAIKEVFGEHAYRLKISSTKSMHGHTIGAAGGIEAIACIMAIRDQFIPPTINLDNPDPECDLDYVPHTGESAKIDYVMSNSFGFGGHNSVVIFKRLPD